MRRSLLAAVIVAGVAAPALAQTAYPNTLLGGEVQRAVVAKSYGVTCYVERGFATWQRNGVNTKAVISFDEISYPIGSSDGRTNSRDLRGQAILTFAPDGANGTIKFKITPDYPGGPVSVPFSGYAETFYPSAGQLSVRFNINFSGCTLSILANFDLT